MNTDLWIIIAIVAGFLGMIFIIIGNWIIIRRDYKAIVGNSELHKRKLLHNKSEEAAIKG